MLLQVTDTCDTKSAINSIFLIMAFGRLATAIEACTHYFRILFGRN